MEKKVEFPCDRCGECCRHIERILQLKYFDRGDGVCKYLDGNLCSIYKNRPDICRVDKMYEQYFYNQYTREEFYRLNVLACNALKKNIIDRNR